MAKRLSRRVASPVKAAAASAVLEYDGLIAAIGLAHESAQRQAVQATNVALTLRNWVIGHYLFEYEQHGLDRAKYGERLLDDLAADLRKRLGRGFGRRNLFLFREFFRRYPIVQSLIAQLGLALPDPTNQAESCLEWQDHDYTARLVQKVPWTHFIELIRLDDPLKRAF